MYSKCFKRFLDIVFAVVLLIILFPLFIIVGIISKITTGSVFFKQKRDGLNKASFTIYKFMSLKEGNVSKTPKILLIIRSLGLNELPQLINIIKGDMSFVGPRPFITGEVLPEYPKDIIYKLRPGVVSLATANGRRKISHEKRLKYDYDYVLNISLKLDIYIIFKTLIVLIKQNTRGELWKK